MSRKRRGQDPRSSGTRQGRKNIRVGVAWYTAEQWEAIRDFANDPEKLEDTHDAWRSMAEKALKGLAAAGVVPEKVYLDASAFRKWCQTNDKDNEATTRAEYASVLLHEKNLASNGKAGTKVAYDKAKGSED